MQNQNMERFYEYLEQTKASRYPIENVYLKEETDYIRNSYCKMLALILTQGNEVAGLQQSLFERLVAGISEDCSASDYVRQALQIEVEEYIHFAEQCCQMPLRYRFILDGILLAMLAQENEEQIKLVSCFAEDLHITPPELKYLAFLAKAILEQDAGAYFKAVEKRVDSVPEAAFQSYLDLMFGTNLYQNERMFVLCGDENGNISLDALANIWVKRTPSLVLYNIRLGLEQYNLHFPEYDTVVLKNCTFEGGSKYPVLFNHCKNVLIDSCTFKNFSSRTIAECGVQYIRIENTAFDHCVYPHCVYSISGGKDYKLLGCVIYTSGEETNGRNVLRNCSFRSCGGKNEQDLEIAHFISDIPSELENCTFEECYHYWHRYGNIRTSEKSMFTSDSKAINCTVINSANIT